MDRLIEAGRELLRKNNQDYQRLLADLGVTLGVRQVEHMCIKVVIVSRWPAVVRDELFTDLACSNRKCYTLPYLPDISGDLSNVQNCVEKLEHTKFILNHVHESSMLLLYAEKIIPLKHSHR